MSENPVSPALQALRDNLAAVLGPDGKLLSEPALAKKAGLDQKTLWRVMRGTNEPTLETLSKLAKACALEPWQLLVPELDPINPPMLASQSDKIKALYDNIKNTKEALEGLLREQGNTRPGDL